MHTNSIRTNTQLWGGHAGTQRRTVSTLHAGGDCYSVAQGFRCVQGCVDGMQFAGMYDVISSAIYYIRAVISLKATHQQGKLQQHNNTKP